MLARKKIINVLLVFISLLLIQPSFSQTKIDSLENLLKRSTGNEKIDLFNKLSWKLRNSEPQRALKYAQSALLLSELRNYEHGKLKALSFAGVAEKNLGNYLNSLSFYYEALALAEKQDNKTEIAYSKINIGNIYIYQTEYKAALKPLEEALENAKIVKKKDIIAYASLNLGRVHSNLGNYDKAFDYMHKTLQIRKKIQDSTGIAACYKYIGDIHFAKKARTKAKRMYFKALEIAKNIMLDKDLIADIYNKLARTYLLEEKITKSEEVAIKSFQFATEIHSLLRLRNATFTLYEVYKTKGKFEQSLDYFQKYIQYKDSLINAQNIKKITQLSEKHKYDKEKEIKRIEVESERLLTNEKIKRQKYIQYFLYALAIGLIVFLAVLIRHNKIKRKKNESLRIQRDKILEQNEEINDSITYASRIQAAILPPRADISKLLPDNFVLYLPKNIVSGDFYWTKTLKYNGKEHIIIIAADCTGHGVPGAFMSMLGIAFLNEIVSDNLQIKELSADTILNKLRNKVIKSLHQTGKEKEAKDGMDISLCLIDIETKKMQFAGAYNSIFLARDNELTKVKADRMPIGIHPKDVENFTRKEIQLKKNDRIYLFSDGYADQFGGLKDSKFLMKNFRKLILENYQKTMIEQKEIFTETLKKWQGNTEQIDDILVLGVKIE